MVTLLSDVLITCMIENGAETQHILGEGQSWRIGRNGKCEVTVKSHPYVSAIAFLIRYPIVPQGQSTPPLTVHVLQRGAARVQVESETGERMFLSRGSYVPLRPGLSYQIDLLTPARIASVQLTTPDLGGDHFPVADSNTQTWSVSGNSDHMPPWLDVAALACVIDLFPDIRPILTDGTQASPSQTLQLATEIFVGRSSIAYYQQKLAEALDAVKIEVVKGQDKQSRVASYFLNFFPREKLNDLKSKIKEPIQALASSKEDGKQN